MPAYFEMKIYNGTPGFGRPLSEDEIIEFLSKSKKNLQLASLDEKNEPTIHPVWFFYENECIYVATEKKSKKVQNILRNNLVYFSIDEDVGEFRGVRGKGTIKILDDVKFNKSITEKIILKHVGSLDGTLAKKIMDEIKNGVEIVLEIRPKFFSTWHFTL